MGDSSDEIDFENLIDLFESSFLEDDTTGFIDEKNEKTKTNSSAKKRAGDAS